jgi:integrase/recombinase XerD
MFLATKKLDGLSDISIYNYGLHLRRFSQFITKNVADITTMDIRRYLAYLMQQYKLKNTSIETEKSVLKSFFNWMEDEEYILKSPARKIKPTKIEKRLRKALDDEELERLRDACKTPRQRALLEFLFSTGCRLSEVAGVDIAHVNWNECNLKVIGKGNKEREVQFSKKSKVYLKKYLSSRGDISNPALFITERKPYSRMGNRAVEREIAKIAEQAGMDKSVYPHLLRHTMATMGLRAGASLQTIQTLLGHDSPATTEIYAEISNETVKEEYRKHLIQ